MEETFESQMERTWNSIKDHYESKHGPLTEEQLLDIIYEESKQVSEMVEKKRNEKRN